MKNYKILELNNDEMIVAGYTLLDKATDKKSELSPEYRLVLFNTHLKFFNGLSESIDWETNVPEIKEMQNSWKENQRNRKGV